MSSQSSLPTSSSNAKTNPALRLARWLYSRRPSTSALVNADPVKVVCLCDKHYRALVIPEGDILIYSGELTKRGTYSEMCEQLAWLQSLPHAHKIAVVRTSQLALCTGYTERYCDWNLNPDSTASPVVPWPSVQLLHDTSTTIHVRGRKIKIFGSAQTPPNYDSSAQCSLDSGNENDGVLDNVDIVVTKKPPKGHMDVSGVGCSWLADVLRTLKPRLHVCGSVVGVKGHEELRWDYIQKVYDDVVAGNKGMWSVMSMAVVCGAKKVWYSGRQKKRPSTTTLVTSGHICVSDDSVTSPPTVVEI